jgi:hypothetical protein
MNEATLSSPKPPAGRRNIGDGHRYAGCKREAQASRTGGTPSGTLLRQHTATYTDGRPERPAATVARKGIDP